MASAKSGERASSFAMACSLLSHYVRQNGAAGGDLSLGIRGEASGVQRTPATTSLNLLPGADAEKGEKRKETMELFPQNAGLRSEAPDAREQEKRQLTIFYGGKIVVFNDFPAEKAKDLMQLASKGTTTTPVCALPPSSTTAAVTDSTKVASVPAPATAQVNAQKTVRPSAADVPQARKASLHRFFAKRKDRINAKAPYQVSRSDATPVKMELPESQPWLGLGPQAANPESAATDEYCDLRASGLLWLYHQRTCP